MTPSLLIFNKTMEDDTLKNQKPSRWVGGASGGEGRGGIQVLRASVGGGAEEAALQRCTQTLRETEPLYTISVYLWKGAEGKGEEINGGISHPVEQ